MYVICECYLQYSYSYNNHSISALAVKLQYYNKNYPAQFFVLQCQHPCALCKQFHLDSRQRVCGGEVPLGSPTERQQMTLQGLAPWQHDGKVSSHNDFISTHHSYISPPSPKITWRNVSKRHQTDKLNSNNKKRK